MVLTAKERCVLRLLAISSAKDYSINDVARKCRIAPNGAYKMLAKLESQGVLRAKPIANIKAYKLDFTNEKTVRVLELAFMPDAIEGRVKLRAGDLQPMRAVTQACILFGSYITTKKEPGDLDVLFVLKRASFEAYKRALGKVQDIVPVRMQDVVQTAGDLQQNIRKENPIVTEALQNGIVLWGFDALVKVIKNANHG